MVANGNHYPCGYLAHQYGVAHRNDDPGHDTDRLADHGRYPLPVSYSDSQQHTQRHPDTLRDGHPLMDANHHPDSDSDANSNRHANGYANPYPHLDSHCYTHSNTPL
jgi:hypothetical protein